MMNKLEGMTLAELTTQMIAVKRARSAEPEYEDWEEWERMTGGVVCGVEENSYKIELLATLRWQRGGGFGL